MRSGRLARTLPDALTAEVRSMSTHAFRRFCLVPLVIVAAIATQSANAAWSTDPTNPLLIAQHDPANQTTPHMVATPDGGFYISWLDYGAGASIRLQRLDAAGNPQWGSTGILVYARNEQYNFNYGLSVDTAGNALLAFDQSYTDGGGTHLPGGNILATKIDAQGNFLWGASGVTVSPPGETELNGQIAGTSDGDAVVAWLDANNEANYQKLAAADGSPKWASAKQFPGFLSGLQGSDGGNVIVSVVNNGAISTQKLAAADGSPLWNGGAAVVLSDGQSATGTVPPGYFPDLISDANGGAVFYWQVSGNVGTTARVQHVNSTGTKLFADNGGNGVTVSTDNTVDIGASGTHNQDNPAAAFDASTGDIYVSYEDWFDNAAGNQPSATFAQRIDNSGARQWSATGMPLESYIPFGADDSVAVPLSGGVIFAWTSAGSTAGPVSPKNIVAQRVNADGSYAWSTTPTAVKTSSSATTNRLLAANSTDAFAAIAWVDNDGSAGDIRAQNLRDDGLLGNQSGSAPGTPTLTAATDSGAQDGITNNTAPQFAGTCNSSGDTIELAVDGAIVTTGMCSGSAYLLTLSTTPPDGMHTVKAVEVSSGGSSAYSASSSFTMDTTPPAIAFTSTPTNPDSASDATFAFTVSEAGTVQCKLDGGTFGTCASPVSYSGLLVGSHSFTVKATDVAQNTGSSTYTWTIAPDPVTVSLDPSTDSGRSNSDDITNANPLLFVGSCTDGDTISVFAGAATLGTDVCSNGVFSVSNGTLGNGKKSISAHATRGGIDGPNGPVLQITIIRTAPPAPAITGPSSADASATISGTAAINAIVAVSDGGNALCSALADSNGNWSCDAAFGTAGANSLTATATDVAGNVSAPSPAFTVNVDLSDLVFRNGFED